MRLFVLVAVVQLNEGRKTASECPRQISSIMSYPARSDKLRYIVCVGHGEGIWIAEQFSSILYARLQVEVQSMRERSQAGPALLHER